LVAAGCGASGPGQVRPDLARRGRPCTIASVHPSMVHLSIVIPIFVYLPIKIALLVPKMCMKLVVYSSQTHGFDGQIFVVRTVNSQHNKRK
jgi:hypothetical protein